MATTALPRPDVLTPQQVRRLLAVLISIFLGVVTFAAVIQRDRNQPDRRECHAFILDASTLDGPDCLQ